MKITLTITMNVDKYIDGEPFSSLHLSRAGHAGTGFDTGENYDEMELAIDDLAAELKNIYKHELKGKA